ncbi:MAG: hypothetical protein WCL70_07950 [Paludibacter sp.]
MKNKSNIAGLFGNLMRDVAPWFLYVFVDAKANLPKEILDKRSNQIWWLQQIDAFNLVYNYDQLLDLVRDGILRKYGKSPEMALQIIYDNAVRINKNSVGSGLDASALTFDPEVNQYYDGSGNAYILDNSGSVVSKNGQYTDLTIESPANLEDIKIAPSTGTSKTFWDDCASVIEWLVKLLKSIGIINGNTGTMQTYSPNTLDWSKVNSTQSASLTGALPIVIGLGIAYSLYKSTKKKGKKA